MGFRKEKAVLMALALIVCLLSKEVTNPVINAQAEGIQFAVVGDYGEDVLAENLVSKLVDSWNPDFIVTVGDNSYGDSDIDDNIGQYFSSFIGSYKGEYGLGSSPNRFFPALGNHDYSDGGGLDAYLDYFTLPGAEVLSTNTSGNERYYDFAIGDVYFMIINSNPEESDGNNFDSVQAQWLHQRLEQSPFQWNIVLFHHSPFSSDVKERPAKWMRWPFEEWGADVVLSGHSHTYERIMRDDNGDKVLLPYFVVGFGGAALYRFSEDIAEGSQVRYDASFGALRVKATKNHLTIEAWSVSDGLIDSYTLNRADACRKMYNDLGWVSDQLNENITHITATTDDTISRTGNLVDYVSGQSLSSRLTVIGGEYSLEEHGPQGSNNLNGDARLLFEGIVSPMGTLSYGNTDERFIILEFTDLVPGKMYDVAFYGNREGPESYEWDRASLVSILSADSYVNASSPGIDNHGEPVFSGPNAPSTRYAANNPAGRVVRFDNIDPGVDGAFSLLVGWNGDELEVEEGNEGYKGYKGLYGSALLLEECDP